MYHGEMVCYGVVYLYSCVYCFFISIAFSFLGLRLLGGEVFSSIYILILIDREPLEFINILA
jgi:hypothetical protein